MIRLQISWRRSGWPCAASDVALGSTQGATSPDWNSLGEVNELENSEDRRSVGRHGNQHVRLRCAQVDTSKATLPGSCGDAPYRAAAGVPSLLQTIVAIVLSKIRVSFLPVCLADMAHQGLRLMHNCRPGAGDGSCD